MTEPAHYKRGPSGAHRWLICTDSPEAEEGYPDETSDAADEGTAAHWLLEQCLKAGMDCTEWMDTHHGANVVPAGESTGCIKDWPITGEMIEAVQLAIDTANKHATKRGTKLFVEERVRVGEHFGLEDQVGGTADITMWLPKSKTLVVQDFKYGKGHVVEVTGGGGNIYEYLPDKDQWVEVKGPSWSVNPQIGLYAIAALCQLERLLGKKVQVKWVDLGIIQPRAYHKKGPVRTKKISPMQLMDLELDLIQAVNGPKRRIPGDHCFFCRAKPDCVPYHESRGAVATEKFEAEFPPNTVPPGAEVVAALPAEDGNQHHHTLEVSPLGAHSQGLDPSTDLSIGGLISRPVKGLNLQELGRARACLATIKAWTKEVEEEIRTRLLHDLKVPGARLAQGNGSRAFGGAPEQVAQAAADAAAILRVDPAELYEPSVLKSPAKLEKQLGKGKFKLTPLAALVTYTAGGPVVVDEDSDKPDYVKDNGFTAEAPAVESPLL